MSQNVYVSNSSPLIAFERLGLLVLLQQLTTSLYIPSAVREEVFGSGAIPDWISERPISQPLSAVALSPTLGPGESEAIILALEIQPGYLLLDDLAARRTAQALNISVMGTIGLLIFARQKNFIRLLKPYLEALLQANFHISDRLYEVALGQVGE